MHTHRTYKYETLQTLSKGIAANCVKIVALFPGSFPQFFIMQLKSWPENEAAKNHWILGN